MPNVTTQAAIAIQSPSATTLVFEAEGNGTLVTGTPENWVVKTDAEASGGGAIYADGTNSTGDSPHSFAQLKMKFATPGTYNLYYRWKADPARTGGDAFTANSSWLRPGFGAFSTTGAGAQADYVRTKSNDGSAPTDNVYAWTLETAATYTVAAGDVGTVQVLTIGSREAGMYFDRFVFATDATLTPAQLDALANSDTDVAAQGPTDAFLAFEGEVKSTLIGGTPENWVVKTDPDASGGSALYADGTNSTGDSPHSFAQLQLKFSAAGTYNLYYRWKADPARTGGDAFTANSSWLRTGFGAFSTPGAGAQADYVRTKSNDGSAPTDNVYTWTLETGATYTVAAGDVGTVQVLTIGSREAGMYFDRFVFSPDATLTPAQLDALVNSGTRPPTPAVKTAVGSAALTKVTLTFTRPLKPSTVVAGNFNLGTVNVTDAALDPDDARIVVLTTAAQTQGTVYTVTVNNVQDVDGTPVQPNTKAQFTAWKLVTGWAVKEIYFGITGTTVADLTADANYLAHKPSKVEWVKGFQLNQAPLTDNYGARISTFWTPGASDTFDLLLNNDDEAELQLSSDKTEDNLTSLGVFPLNAAFDDSVVATTPALTAGTPYLIVGLLKQGTGDVYFNVGVRRQGSGIPADQAALLAGARIATFVNPDLGKITFDQQPANVTAAEHGRATFRVVVKALTSPVYYQWQANGVDIPGAVRAAYTTPALTAGDSGKKFRCVVSVAGTDTISGEATLTVGPGEVSSLQPYLGLNLVGGGTAGGASLSVVDVAGVVPQENWNNLTGFTFDAAALKDAVGGATPVTLSGAQGTEVWYSGTVATLDANGALFQGFVSAGSSLDPVHFTLNNVPAGKYDLLVYSLGFDFTPDYRTAFALTGGGTYPVYHGKAETGLPYQNNPAFRRMSSTSAASPDTGNYVQFDNVSPAADGSLDLAVTWESAEAGNTHQPAVNAIQLVRVVDVPKPIAFTAPTVGPAGIVLAWTGGTGPFLVQGKLSLADAWVDLVTTADHTATIPLAGFSGFFRIVDGTAKTVKLFHANLNGANERPTPVTTAGTGTGLLALDTTALTATYVVSYHNLSSAPVAYHLHGLGTAEQAVGVKFGLVPSGALTAASGQFVGQNTVDAATAAGIAAGQTYFNVHTTANGGGEIRGQVLP